MITKKEFINFIESYEIFENGINRIIETLSGGKPYTIDLWGCNWVDAVCKMWDNFIYSHFTNYGTDWIFYFLWEDTNDKAAYIKQEGDMFNEEKEIRYSLESADELWDFLQTDVKAYFKNV